MATSHEKCTTWLSTKNVPDVDRASLTNWRCSIRANLIYKHHHTTLQPFYSPFSGPRGWAGARRELLDFMVQGKTNRGRYTDHPAGRHSIRINQCPPPPSPIINL